MNRAELIRRLKAVAELITDDLSRPDGLVLADALDDILISTRASGVLNPKPEVTWNLQDATWHLRTVVRGYPTVPVARINAARDAVRCALHQLGVES